MRIAFVDYSSAVGGIVRYSNNLASSLVKFHPDVTLEFFTHEYNYLSNSELFNSNNKYFTTKIISATKQRSRIKTYLISLYDKLFNITHYDRVHKEIYKITKNFDIVFFTSIQGCPYFKVEPLSFGIFHDFNWMYLFGAPLFSKDDVRYCREQTEKWFNSCDIILSSEHVRNDLIKFFPNIKSTVNVIYLSSLGHKAIEIETDLLKDLGLNRPFILYPAHLMPHKNHITLISAFHRINQMEDYKDKYLLVFSGSNSDHFEYGKITPFGIEMSNSTDYNFRGLGYLPNNVVDYIISKATLVISTSLNEAGSGPAMDAWINNVPCIISNIGAHRSQLDFFQIECITFDPLDVHDLKSKIIYAINNLDILKDYSKHAAEVFKNYDWKAVAEQYYNVFNLKFKSLNKCQ
jgi:glycosyltransferase involved in cell wall biosynthesis